jgi:hypothetical protein
MPKNEKCVVTDSVICKWIDKDCKDCYLKEMKDDSDTMKVLENFQVTLSLLPDEFDSLQSQVCSFCQGEPNKRACYATIDLAHKDPEQKRGMFFGMGKRVRQRIGSLLPVSISICSECRRNFRTAESLKWLMILVFGGIGLGLCFIPGINSSQIMPYVVMLAGILVGYVAGKILSAAYVDKKSAKTRFNVFDIPVCAQMRDNGWFPVQDEGPVTRYIFTKKPMMKRLCDVGIEHDKKLENI